MAEGLLGGVLGEESEKPETEAPGTLAGADAFAAAVAARLSASDPEVARDTSAFLKRQAQLLETQNEHLKDEHALRLAHLAHQSHLLLGQRLGQAIRLSFQIVIALVVIVIGVGIAVMLHDAFTSRSVVIDAFNAPAALAARGVTGTVVASEVLDELTLLQNTAVRGSNGFGVGRVKRNLTSAWSDPVKVDVPETGVSLGEISRLLKTRFGHDLHIGGDLVETDTGGLALTVRGDDLSPRTFSGSAHDLDKLVLDAAQYVWAEFQPGLWATYLLDAGRCPEVIAFIKSVYAGMAPGPRAGLLSLWGVCLDTSGSHREALERFQEAVGLIPDAWGDYINEQQALMNLGDEEGAWRVGEVLRRRAAAARLGTRVGAFLLAGWWDQLTGNLLAERNALVANAEANEGIGSSVTSNGWRIAQIDVQLHDPAAAQLTLQTLQSDDQNPTTSAQTHFARGLLDEELGEVTQAAVEMEAFGAALADPRVVIDLGFSAAARCQIAPAEEAAGRPEEADAAIRGSEQVADCQRLRGDILDHRGDWPGAQQAYAAAVALAPDLPAAYYSWGVALARHGALAGALAKLQAANQRGPHWADPLKTWGDVLAKQGHWKDALTKYDEALKYAPEWAALKQARDAAARKSS